MSAKDPRTVIKLINSFISDYKLAKIREEKELFKKGYVTSRPEILAILTVIKVNFPEIFNQYKYAPNSIKNLMNLEEQNNSIKIPEDLKNYLSTINHHYSLNIDLRPFVFFNQTDNGYNLGLDSYKAMQKLTQNNNNNQLKEYFGEITKEKSIFIINIIYELNKMNFKYKENAYINIIKEIDIFNSEKCNDLIDDVINYISNNTSVAKRLDIDLYKNIICKIKDCKKYSQFIKKSLENIINRHLSKNPLNGDTQEIRDYDILNYPYTDHPYNEQFNNAKHETMELLEIYKELKQCPPKDFINWIINPIAVSPVISSRGNPWEDKIERGPDYLDLAFIENCLKNYGSIIRPLISEKAIKDFKIRTRLQYYVKIRKKDKIRIKIRTINNLHWLLKKLNKKKY